MTSWPPLKDRLRRLPRGVRIGLSAALLSSLAAGGPPGAQRCRQKHWQRRWNIVAEDDLTESVKSSKTRDLLGRLARAFNRMTARLRASFEQAIRYSSDASHELRTPLTILRSQLENARQISKAPTITGMCILLDGRHQPIPAPLWKRQSSRPCSAKPLGI